MSIWNDRWTRHTVQEVTKRVKVGYVGSCQKDYCDSRNGVPMIRTTNLTDQGLDCSDLKYVTKEFHNKNIKSQLHKNDVLIARHGDNGRACIFDNEQEANCLNIVIIEPDEKKALAKYINYVFRYEKVRLQIQSLTVGSVQNVINTKTIASLDIGVPSVNEQKKIVDLLSSFDEKIQTNKQINQNLQEQAKALYSDMIVDKADGTWIPGTLSDVAIVTMGQSPKGDTYNEDGTGTVFFQGRAEFGFRFPTRRLYTTEPKRMAQSNDALMSVRAPVGDMNVAYEDCCIGRGLSAIRSKDGHQSYVFYTMFDLREQLDVFNGEGTVFGSINRDALNNLPISIPPKKVMDQFEALVSPMDAAIRNNYEEICRLESLRDSLLPRLMSGELDVSEIEI